MVDKLNAVHVFHQQKLLNAEQEQEASELEQEIMEKGHLSADAVIETVKTMLGERVDDKKEQNILIDMAEDVYKESVGDK